MLKDYKKWMNRSNTKIEVYDLLNARYFSRPLTVKESSVILLKNSQEIEEKEILT